MSLVVQNQPPPNPSETPATRLTDNSSSTLSDRTCNQCQPGHSKSQRCEIMRYPEWRDHSRYLIKRNSDHQSTAISSNIGKTSSNSSLILNNIKTN